MPFQFLLALIRTDLTAVFKSVGLMNGSFPPERNIVIYIPHGGYLKTGFPLFYIQKISFFFC